MGEFSVSGNDDIIIIGTQRRTELAEAFPDLSFCSIAIERGSACFKSNAYAEMPNVIGYSKNRTQRKTKNVTFGKETPVLPRVVESTRKPK